MMGGLHTLDYALCWKKKKVQICGNFWVTQYIRENSKYRPVQSISILFFWGEGGYDILFTPFPLKVVKKEK